MKSFTKTYYVLSGAFIASFALISGGEENPKLWDTTAEPFPAKYSTHFTAETAVDQEAIEEARAQRSLNPTGRVLLTEDLIQDAKELEKCAFLRRYQANGFKEQQQEHRKSMLANIEAHRKPMSREGKHHQLRHAFELLESNLRITLTNASLDFNSAGLLYYLAETKCTPSPKARMICIRDATIYHARAERGLKEANRIVDRLRNEPWAHDLKLYDEAKRTEIQLRIELQKKRLPTVIEAAEQAQVRAERIDARNQASEYARRFTAPISIQAAAQGQVRAARNQASEYARKFTAPISIQAAERAAAFQKAKDSGVQATTINKAIAIHNAAAQDAARMEELD